MAGEKKNQHYVPQVYLRRFCDTQGKVSVFDKEKEEIRRNVSITTIASERYFYDVDLITYDKMLREQGKPSLSEQFPGYEKTDPQYIENLFSKEIESDYEDYIGVIIDRLTAKSPWEIWNCYAISKDEKQILALWAALQIVRSKSFRDKVKKLQKAHAQMVEEMINSCRKPDETITVTANTDKESMRAIHADIILNTDTVDHYTGIFQSHSWILSVNMTNEPFATSDNPILTIPHKWDPYIQHSGLASPSVEVFFPLSPKVGLMMFEKSHDMNNYDRRSVLIEDPEIVRQYNYETLRNASRNLITKETNLRHYAEYTKNHPEIRKDVISLMYNGKTYLFD